MQKLTLKDIPIKDKTLLIRVDYNVPMSEGGQITDDSRVVKSLETLRYALGQNAKLVLMSHLGRPKGKPDAKYSLRPVAEHLSRLIQKKVLFLEDCVGADVERKIKALGPGDVALLENLRFHAEEEKNGEAFAKQLAALGDIYVNDAFGSAHRAHASTVGVTRYLPAVAGMLLDREINYFDKAITNPDRPFVTILGGAKVSDKIKLISNLLEVADHILIGGAMAYTFYKVMGIGIGNSKFEPGGVPAAKEALELSKSKKVPIDFPVDRVIAEKLEKNVPTQVIESDIPDGWSGFDVGPKTCEKFIEVLKTAKTVVWNGPLGVFEVPPFDQGTKRVAEAVAKLRATTIIGGGDTAAAVKKFGLEEKMSHVSTGGGASLEYLEGTTLPGVAALKDKKKIETKS